MKTPAGSSDRISGPAARISLTILFLLIQNCAVFLRPWKSFQEYVPPPAPDYSDLRFWAAHPDKRDAADDLPEPSLHDEQASSSVDVFFIHPTTSYTKNGWNEFLENESVNRRTDEESIRHQATIFNCCARVFAPRYRQATLYSFIDESGSGEKALEFAFADVLAAFDEYMRTQNRGRPVILAGHSQGAYHVMRLLKARFDRTPVFRQLIAAYAVGATVNQKEYPGFRPCISAEDTGCYITWNTFRTGGAPGYFPERYEQSVCINPLTWKMDEEKAPASLNLGGVDRPFDRILKEVCSAQCRSGILYIDELSEGNFTYLPGRNFHVADYNLFYMNIRENLRLRISRFRKNQ